MALNSWGFLLLAVSAILAVRLTQSVAVRKAALLGFSLVFLATYLPNVRTTLTLCALLAVVYALGHPAVRRVIGWSGRMAVAAITLLWALLFLIKDPNLFGSLNPFHHAPVLIIGISYLVFRSISYLMESELVEQPNVADFLNYMLFFPTLLAGPIERFKPFTASYAEPKGGAETVLPALHRIANGYIKKFAIADNLAAFSVASVADPATTAVPVLWIAALLQLFLIWLDFSGYCDIAIGIGRLMGISVSENFGRPFAAVNIREFWERWHMSMSSLMRDYIFTPICRVILTTARSDWHWPLITAAYCLIMMLIALWHGTTLGFLVFGLLHGAVLVAIQILQGRRPKGKPPALSSGERTLWQGLTYVFVSVTLVLWMAQGGKWLDYYSTMFGVK